MEKIEFEDAPHKEVKKAVEILVPCEFQQRDSVSRV